MPLDLAAHIFDLGSDGVQLHDLAKHIVNQKASTFEPEKFEDHYEEALTKLINAKRNGKTVTGKPRPRGENVVDLMDALKRSIGQSEAPAPVKRQKATQGRRRSKGNAAPNQQQAASQGGEES